MRLREKRRRGKTKAKRAPPLFLWYHIAARVARPREGLRAPPAARGRRAVDWAARGFVRAVRHRALQIVRVLHGNFVRVRGPPGVAAVRVGEARRVRGHRGFFAIFHGRYLYRCTRGYGGFRTRHAAPLALSSSLPAVRQAASSFAPSAPPGGRKLRRTAGRAHGWAGKAAGREQADACRARERSQRACGHPQRRRIPFVHRYFLSRRESRRFLYILRAARQGYSQRRGAPPRKEVEKP